jgi:putative transposase
MARTCSKLDIMLLYAKPYSPEATRKVEKVNQTVQDFPREAVLNKSQTLEQYN